MACLSNRDGDLGVDSSAKPFSRRVPGFVEVEPQGGPRENGVGNGIVWLPFAASRQEQTEPLLRVHVRYLFAVSTLSKFWIHNTNFGVPTAPLIDADRVSCGKLGGLKFANGGQCGTANLAAEAWPPQPEIRQLLSQAQDTLRNQSLSPWK